MGQITYLITGANRGLGLALTKTYLARDFSTVVAGVRDSDHASAKALDQLSKGQSSTLIVAKINSLTPDDPFNAVEQLKTSYGITSLDIVIANAGISTVYPPVADAKPAEVQAHFNVNVIGPLSLFQAVRPLLLKATSPKFVTMSSSAGSIGGIETRPQPNAAYGTSKAALNYITRKIHFENESIIAFPIDPGWVRTDMGNGAAIMFGVPGGLAETSIEESAKGVATVIDEATKEATSGKFPMFNGEMSPW